MGITRDFSLFAEQAGSNPEMRGTAGLERVLAKPLLIPGFERSKSLAITR
jgi:hypothetical protein